MSSCHRGYGIAGYPECSGHGECVLGQCICHADWTSIGDFNQNLGYDCDVHIPTIRGLYIAMLVCCLPFLVLASKLLLSGLLSRKFTKNLEILSMLLTATLSGYVMAALKIYDPITYVLNGSIVFSIAGTVYVTAKICVGASRVTQLMTFLEGCLKMLSPDKREDFMSYTKYINVLLIIIQITALIATLTIFLVGIYVLDRTNSFWVGFTFDLVNIVLLLGSVSINHTIYSKFFKQMYSCINTNESQNSSGNSALVNVIQQAEKIRMTGAIMYSMWTSFLLVDMLWYFIRRKFSYLIPIGVIVSDIMYFVVYFKQVSIFPKQFSSANVSTSSWKSRKIIAVAPIEKV